MSSVNNEAFVTLATNDTYSMGAMVLAHSLKSVGTSRKLVILISPGVSADMRKQLESVFDLVQVIDVLNSNDKAILAAMKRPELGVTLSKIHCWKLTQFTKCVFMDADTLVIKPIDELFQRDQLSAVPDIGWPDCFNTGVFVFQPSEETFNALIQLAASEGSFDGGDQGLLNTYFADWSTKDISRHLSFVYNMSTVAVYSYPPAYKKFGNNVKVVHFLGVVKPWMYTYNTTTQRVQQPHGSQTQQLEHIQKWWDIYMEKVQRNFDPVLVDKMVNLQVQSSSASKPGTSVRDDPWAGMKAWESGNIDYMGEHGSDKIIDHLKSLIQ